ncbi:MAG: hypothetical protein ACT4P6_00010 [Gemmatimonadaceae bacterium]
MRDVLNWSNEIARLLNASAASVQSALQRACGTRRVSTPNGRARYAGDAAT